MYRYFVRLSSPFADAVWTVCRREAEIIDIRTGYPLVERHVVVYRAADAAEATREADRRNALEQRCLPDHHQAEPRP